MKEVFSFIFKAVITLLLFFGIAYYFGYGKTFIDFFKLKVVPTFKEVVSPAVNVAKDAAEVGVDAAKRAAEKVEMKVDTLKNRYKTGAEN